MYYPLSNTQLHSYTHHISSHFQDKCHLAFSLIYCNPSLHALSVLDICRCGLAVAGWGCQMCKGGKDVEVQWFYQGKWFCWFCNNKTYIKTQMRAVEAEYKCRLHKLTGTANDDGQSQTTRYREALPLKIYHLGCISVAEITNLQLALIHLFITVSCLFMLP